MTTPVGCALWIDGAQVADGSQRDDGSPVALSGLKVTWGRGTTVDQPEPSTASFDLVNPAGGAGFGSLLYTGARVDITAAGTVPAPATLPINVDGSFETLPPGSTPGFAVSGGTVTVTTTRARTGGQSLEVLSTGGAMVRMEIPPAPASSDPAAWDDLPTMQRPETWAANIWAVIPLYGIAYLQMLAFQGPTATGTPKAFGLRTVVAGSGSGWVELAAAGDVPAAQVGWWLGVLVDIQETAWQPAGGPAPGYLDLTWETAPGSWQDWAAGYVDDLAVLAPSSAGAVHRDVLVFSGRITDLDAGWDFQAGAVRSSVVAADFTADLANRDVADQPWPAEPLAARFGHVVAAAGVAVPYTLAPSLTGYQVSYMDVDRQQCWPLLADLATSVDGVLWSAVHPSTGPYLWLADPRVQSALYQLTMGDAGLVVIVATAAGGAAIELDSCDLLLDPVVFRQAVSDISTRVAITWLEQTIDDNTGQPAPTERTDIYTDAAAELANGTRRLGVQTVLTSAAVAGEVAALLLGRLHRASWRVSGLTWRTDKTQMDGDQTSRTLDLLDGVRRLAAALLLTNLPSWAPAGPTLPLLLQGGQYTFEDGQWTLDLVTSSAAAQGTGLPWNALDPAWAWNEFDPAIDWTDLVGVAP